MKPLIQVQNLKQYFHLGGKTLKAVDDLSLEIFPNETLGLVGESGCGKSTLARTLARLYRPYEGKILFNGVDISNLTQKELLPFRQKMQMIFQDPYSSLNPRMTVLDIIGEALDIHQIAKGLKRTNRVIELLEKVGLQEEHINRFPHEFSGGQRQRIGIARALAVEPQFLICDEAISALDVSVQAQIVNLLKDLQEEMGLSYLFIAHDIAMVRHISHRIAVMYQGKIVEINNTNDIFSKTQHPYTKTLLNAVPKIPSP